jgi:hypothetical protein
VKQALRALLEEVASGGLSVEAALERMAGLPFESVSAGDRPDVVAAVDHHRPLLSGAPEVIYGEGKTPEEAAAVARALIAGGANVLVTRASEPIYAAVREVAPDARWHARARIVSVRREAPPRLGALAVACAGTSDLPVAEEAALVAEHFGIETERITDVGVAGLHRTLAARDRMEKADVVIVVAGMEGALPSVVGGLVSRPVIAVPTSVGYGASFGGLAALLAMLNSCAAGVTVVNIDNGFGAAMAARRLLASRAR